MARQDGLQVLMPSVHDKMGDKHKTATPSTTERGYRKSTEQWPSTRCTQPTPQYSNLVQQHPEARVLSIIQARRAAGGLNAFRRRTGPITWIFAFMLCMVSSAFTFKSTHTLPTMETSMVRTLPVILLCLGGEALSAHITLVNSGTDATVVRWES